MLKSLSIRNVALIERADLEFSEGLNVLSGETGAGKSVILDCIDFVLGAKADKGMVRYGESECLVRAEFSCESAALRELLASFDIEADETLLISRKLNTDGRSSLKVNGVTVTVSMLRQITSLLVDVHGQSEHFFLLKERNQLRLLDSIGGEKVAGAKRRVAELLAERSKILSGLAVLGGDEGERARRLDVLRYQIDELSRAELKEGEEEALLAQREKFRNAEKILEGLSEARDALRSDGGGVDLLRAAIRALHSVSRFSTDYGALAERLENALAEAEDIADETEEELSGFDMDEQEANRVESRLDEIKSLKKKYGGSVEAAIAFLTCAKEEFSALEDSGERFEKLSRELTQTEDALFAACLALTAARKETAKGFTERVAAELKTLAIGAARFEIEFGEYSREDVPKTTSEGLGEVRFLFSANRGEPLKPLDKIISGGEMSRFMLAVKAQMSAVGEIGTYIFDEIDAGIGGETARAVGEKFCTISKNTQIIAVSHLARIAAFADRNFLIEKREEGGRTFTRIRNLERDDLLSEIARLIGGDTGEIATEHARLLLREAELYKNSLSRIKLQEE